MNVCLALLFLSGLAIPGGTAAGQAVQGIVVEEDTRVPVAQAVVELLSGREVINSARTDSAGTFVLLVPRSGNYHLRVRHQSFTGPDSLRLAIRSDEVVSVELRMGVAAIPLEPLVVTHRTVDRLAGFRERVGRPGGAYITRDQIEQRSGARAADLLRTIPGVSIVPIQTAMGTPSTSIITIRSTVGDCPPTVYVDGLPVRQFTLSGIDDYITRGMLEGVEIYTNPAAAPPPIDARGGCGAVAFWTRQPDTGGGITWRRIATGVAVLGAMAAFVVLGN